MVDVKQMVVVAANEYCDSKNGDREEKLVRLTSASAMYLAEGGTPEELSALMGNEGAVQNGK